MANLNEVRLIGNLGADPDLRYTQNGKPVCTLSIATNREWKDEHGKEFKEVSWHRVVVWGKQAENANEYLDKGDPVFIAGRLHTRDYEDDKGTKKWITEVIAQSVQFLKPKPKGQQAPHPADRPNGSASSSSTRHSPNGPGDVGDWSAPDGPPPPTDDEIPF